MISDITPFSAGEFAGQGGAASGGAVQDSPESVRRQRATRPPRPAPAEPGRRWPARPGPRGHEPAGPGPGARFLGPAPNGNAVMVSQPPPPAADGRIPTLPPIPFYPRAARHPSAPEGRQDSSPGQGPGRGATPKASLIPAQGKARPALAGRAAALGKLEKGITPLPCARSAWEGGRGQGFCPRTGAVSGCARRHRRRAIGNWKLEIGNVIFTAPSRRFWVGRNRAYSASAAHSSGRIGAGRRLNCGRPGGHHRGRRWGGPAIGTGDARR